MNDKKCLDYEGLKLYDQQLKTYIDKKIAEAIEAYRTENEVNNNTLNNQSGDEE